LWASRHISKRKKNIVTPNLTSKRKGESQSEKGPAGRKAWGMTSSPGAWAPCKQKVKGPVHGARAKGSYTNE